MIFHLLTQSTNQWNFDKNLNDYDEINGDLTVDYEDLADGIDDMVEIY